MKAFGDIVMVSRSVKERALCSGRMRGSAEGFCVRGMWKEEKE